MALSDADRVRERAESLPHVAVLTLVGGLVVLGVTAAALALWEGRAVVLLVFLAYTLGAAMRPGACSSATTSSPSTICMKRPRSSRKRFPRHEV